MVLQNKPLGLAHPQAGSSFQRMRTAPQQRRTVAFNGGRHMGNLVFSGEK
jgi:hypothetical protein